ncbi:hypothetical protein PIB30_090916, partial [Stylosanthes scabra]|nr:hypothetical protein [Stylosanthes scabra]
MVLEVKVDPKGSSRMVETAMRRIRRRGGRGVDVLIDGSGRQRECSCFRRKE